MDYQDASSSPTATDTSSAGSAPVARPDVDGLAPGSFGPASGNTISGSGTITGTAGADSLGDAPASIVSVQGAGGTAAPAGGNAQVSGQYGVLNIDAQGNFSYVRNGGTPDGVEDVFGYTLADRDGSTSSSTLTIQIGQTQSAALDGVVNLPAGVEMSDIRVQGNDLIVTLPDGSTMLIPGGAVFVPQLVIGDTQVPAANVAALLVRSEPPTPGSNLQSGGANLIRDVPPLDPGIPLGDLIPPTELVFTLPEFEDVGQEIDEEPVAGVTAAELDDDEQSNGNAGGVGDDPFGSTDSGQLPGSDGDGSLAWAFLTSGAPTGFSYSAGPGGSVLVFQNGNPNAVLSITVNSATGAYTVTQLGAISHAAGNDENNLILPISYSVTDDDGDVAVGTLNVNIDDDTPIARDDTDALAPGQKSTDGNVVTAVGTTSAPTSADSPGADGLGSPTSATDGVTGIRPFSTATFSEITNAGVTVNGQFGSLLMNPNGSYVYTRFDNSRQGGTDVFVYRIIDGDGDPATATLTITVPADPIPVPVNTAAIVDDDGLVDDGNQDDGLGDDVVPDNDGDGLQSTYRGTLTANFSTDGPGAEPFNFAAMNGVEQTIGQETVRYSWNDVSNTLTAEIISSPDGSRVESDLFKIVVQTSGQFDVTLLQNVLHTPPGVGDPPAFENNEVVNLTFNAVDSNNDSAPGTLTLTFDDDIPTALPPFPPNEPGDPTTPRVGGLVDEDDLDEDAPQNDNVTGNDDSQPGDDAPVDAAADADPTTTGGGAGSLAALFNAGADEPLSFTLSEDTTGLPALRSNGVLLVYDVTVNDVTGVSVLTATAGAETIFTLTVNENGSWVFNLQGALDHPAPLDGIAFENNIDIDFSALVLATDADGDTVPGAPGAFVLTVDDDVPTAKPPTPPTDPEGDPIPLITGLVDEDDLSPGNTPPDNSTGNQDLPVASPGDDDPDNVDGDNDGTTVGANKPSLASLFNPGADQPLTILLSTNTADLAAQGLKSNGATVLYDVNVETGVLTGYVNTNGTAGFQAGDRVVFTLTVDDETGSWEFDLVDQLDHSIPGTEDNILIDFSSVITAVDSDGDPVTAQDGTFVINVDDDMPQPFDDPTDPNDPVCPEDAIATNQPGTHVLDIPLNLPPVGADEPFTLTFGVSTDPNNPTPVMDNGDPPQPILSNGLPLFYFINESDPTILEGRTSVGADPVFTIDLDPAAGTYDFHLLGDITSEVTVSIPITEAIGGGNVDAKGIDVADTPFDLILSTSPGDTVNTNAGFIGISGAQALEANDVVRIDFVQNVFGTSGGGGDVLNFGEYYAVNSFRQDVGGLNPVQFASFTVRALVAVEAGGSDPSDPADGDGVFFGDTNDTTVATGTSIKIYDESGVEITDFAAYNAGNGSDPDLVVTANGDGSWTITGLPDDFDYEIISGTPFNAVQVQALASTDTFKLGAITVTRVEAVAVDFSVPITLTDADGDPVTCDIDVVLTPGVAAAAAQATLDDDGLANANPLGSADIDANANDDNAGQPGDTEAVFVGTLTVTGGVGDIDFRLIAPADPIVIGQETVTLSGTDGLLTAVITSSPDNSREGETLFTIELDIDTGEYTVTLLRNVLHGDDANDNEDGVEVAISVGYEAEDANGDTSVGSLQIIFNDDVPFANTPTPTGLPVLIVDESPLLGAGNDGDNSDTKAFAPAFAGTFGYGADGEGDLQYTLVLNGDQAAGIGSGLFDLDPTDTEIVTDPLGKGAQIMLYTNGLNVEGRIGATVYFTISVNADTGEVTLARNPAQNIWHDLTTDHDDPELLTAALNALQLRQTVIDADGDRASAVIDLSRNVFRFEDDGPSAGLNLSFTKPVLIVDESPLAGAGNDGDNSDTEAFAGAFSAVTDFGTDGEGDIGYTLVLNGDQAAGIGSGLFDLDPTDTEIVTDPLGKGAEIMLYTNGLNIEGRIGATVYFTISVNADTGEVTLARNPDQNIWHDLTTDHDDAEILTAALNTIQLKQTVTDADGDQASEVIDLSRNVFRFDDDGPTADPDTGNVLEGGTLTVPASGVRADDDFGTDGPGTIIGVASGSNTSLVVSTGVGTQIETSLGFLTLNANGSYEYISKAGSVGPGGATDTFIYTIRDADGDTSTTTLTISIGNNNLTPIANQPGEVWLDDDTISGNADGPGDRTPDLQNETGTLSGTGGDGDLDVYLSAVQSLPTNFTYAFDAAAPAGQQWLVISQSGTAVIKVTLVNETGAYTVTQLAAIDHAEDGDTEGETLLGTIISQINVSFYVQDSDVPADQSPTKNLVITVDDDTPENNAGTVSITVHEDALATAGATGNSTGEGAKTATASFTVAQIQGLVDAGADTPVTIGFNDAIEGTATGLTQNNVSITWDYIDATHVRGVVGGNTVFTLTRNGSNYDFVLVDNIDNNPLTGAGDADTDSLNLASVFTATDADGDTIVIDAGASVLIENDIPANNAGTVSITVHEDALNNAAAVGNSTGEGAKTTTGSFTVAQIQGLVNPGADSPVAIGFNDAIEGTATGLTQNNVSITWDYIDATHVRGVVGGNTVFTLTRNGSNYDFELVDNIDNNPLTGAGDADTDSLSLANVFTATDTDGDKIVIDGGASVLIENDVPTNNAGTVSITVHEDALNNLASVGNSAGEGAKTVNGSFTVAQIIGLANAGADSPVTVAFNDAIEGTNTGLTQGGVAIKWDYIDATHVRGLVNGDPTKVAFTLTRNGSNYDFVLLDNIDNDNDANLNTGHGDADTDSLSLANVFVVTDTDGDKLVIDGGASVLIENDIPIIGTIDNGTANNDINAAHSFGDLNFVVGADEPAKVTSITLTTTATSGNRPIVTQFDPVLGKLTAYQDVGPAGYDAGDTTIVFTLTVDPDGGTSGTWDFDLVTPLDTTTTPTDIGGSSSFGAGPTVQGQVLTDGVPPTPAPLSVVSGYNATGSFNLATWQAGGLTPAMVLGQDVNGSTAGWGVDDNNFNTDSGGVQELIFFDFGAQPLSDPDGPDPDGAGPIESYVPPPVSLPNISFATFEFIGYANGGNKDDDIAYVVHLVNPDGTSAGSVTGFIPAVNINGAEWTYTAPAGKYIADISFYSGANDDGSVQDLPPGKIDLVRVGVETISINKDLNFTVELSDSDGDKVSGSFLINVNNTNSPSTLAAFSEELAMQRTALFNTTMMGAIAAAGLESTAYAVTFDDDDGSGKLVATYTASEPGEDLVQESATLQPLTIDEFGGDQASAEAAPDSSNAGGEEAADSGADEDAAAATAPAELDEGTDAPVAESSTSPFMAQDIILPAEMLEADAGEGGIQHNAIVGKVLVDALAGGGPSIDVLVNGGPDGLAPIATLAPADVPIGDGADIAGFSAGQIMPMLEQMAMHQDAAPAQA